MTEITWREVKRVDVQMNAGPLWRLALEFVQGPAEDSRSEFQRQSCAQRGWQAGNERWSSRLADLGQSWLHLQA